MRLAPPSPGETTRVFGPASGGTSLGNPTGARPSPHSPPVYNSGFPRSGGAGWNPPRSALPQVSPQGGWPETTSQALSPYLQPHAELSSRTHYPIHALVCAECGLPRSAAMDTCPYCGRVLVNNSGHNAPVPVEVASGWNWGAFFLPVPWSIAHENWFGLLALVPGLNLVMMFVLGARGNELAWERRRFHSVEHFLEVQRTWRNWSIGAMAVFAALWVMLQFAGGG
ncbi:MAG: hypothetical protein M3Y56_00955 [Armatimonadota bacterium]|nr:hypothetical protein [Armatimonadota bacterium]